MRPLRSLALVGGCVFAATAIGEDVSESIFVAREGSTELPAMFTARAVADLLGAALYVPLVRGVGVRGGWRRIVAAYALTLVLARAYLFFDLPGASYGLYLGHELTGTMLTIHWGILTLDVLDVGEARRSLPILYTIGRVGALLGGLALTALAPSIGAAHAMLLAAALALASAAVPWRDSHQSRALEQPKWPWQGWRRGLGSSLVAAIAVSTACMVLLRYGLQYLALDGLGQHFSRDATAIAGFLGRYTAGANAIGVLLGLVVVPRLLERFGPGVANVAYAVAMLIAYVALASWQGGDVALAGIVVARFTQLQLKHALKTPLSTFFYGAEPPPDRVHARAFVFGIVIPLATIAGGLAMGLAQEQFAEPRRIIALVGGSLAVLFVLSCVVQNRRWRARLVDLLAWHLDAERDGDSAGRARIVAMLGAVRSDRAKSLLARGLASPRSATRAAARELLRESLPRRRYRAIARQLDAADEPTT